MSYLADVGWELLLDTETDSGTKMVLGGGIEFHVGGDGISARKALPAGTKRT